MDAMAPHSTASNWVRVTELPQSALAPSVETSSTNSEENALYWHIFELRELAYVEGQIDGCIKAFLPKVILFDYALHFFLRSGQPQVLLNNIAGNADIGVEHTDINVEQLTTSFQLRCPKISSSSSCAMARSQKL